MDTSTILKDFVGLPQKIYNSETRYFELETTKESLIRTLKELKMNYMKQIILEVCENNQKKFKNETHRNSELNARLKMDVIYLKLTTDITNVNNLLNDIKATLNLLNNTRVVYDRILQFTSKSTITNDLR